MLSDSKEAVETILAEKDQDDFRGMVEAVSADVPSLFQQATELSEAEAVWQEELHELTAAQAAENQEFKVRVTRAAALEECSWGLLLVVLDAPLQVAVRDEHVWLKRLAGERAEAVAALQHRLDRRLLVGMAVARHHRVCGARQE